jgi:hypothetical protein
MLEVEDVPNSYVPLSPDLSSSFTRNLFLVESSDLRWSNQYLGEVIPSCFSFVKMFAPSKSPVKA